MDYVTIRHGAARLTVRLEKIREWPMVNWKGAMRLISKSPELNREAVDALHHWFPEALREATREMQEAKTAYNAAYRPLKEIPKEKREKQKYLNQAVYTAFREARNKEEKLKRRYLEFMAAKASIEKE